MANENEDGGDLSYMDAHFEKAGIPAESGNETTSGASTESGTSNDTTGSASGQDQISGADGKDKLGGAGDKSGEQGKKEEGKKAPAADAQLPAGSLKLQDGTIVNAGQERRWFDQMNLTRQQLTATKNDLNTVTQKHNTLQERYTALETATKQLGLEKPEDVSASIALYKDLQRDVKGTLEKLLAEAKAKGYDIDGIGSNVDTRAITALLDRKLQPSEQQQQQQRQQQIAQEVDAEVQTFVRDFPDALIHEAFIAKIVEGEAAKGNNISLRDAMFALKQNCIQNGFDWMQPLPPQIDARQQRGGQQQQQQQAPRQLGRTPAEAATEEIDPAKVIRPDNDTSDAIVRAAMKEAGLRV